MKNTPILKPGDTLKRDENNNITGFKNQRILDILSQGKKNDFSRLVEKDRVYNVAEALELLSCFEDFNYEEENLSFQTVLDYYGLSTCDSNTEIIFEIHESTSRYPKRFRIRVDGNVGARYNTETGFKINMIS